MTSPADEPARQTGSRPSESLRQALLEIFSKPLQNLVPPWSWKAAALNYRLQTVPAPRLLRMLPYLKYRNAHGAHIYVRPAGESSYTLLDDLTQDTLLRHDTEGYAPAAVVETSTGSFQAWLRHEQPLSKELGTLAAKTLADRFAADRSAADWRRFGRAPGFTNRKPQHRNVQSLYAFVRLISHRGQVFPLAELH